MLKTLGKIAKAVWAVSVVAAFTTIGAIYGWQQHGWIGAIALAFVGLCFGALAAASPAVVLQFLR